MTECAEEYIGIDTNKNAALEFFNNPMYTQGLGENTYYKRSEKAELHACDSVIILADETDKEDTVIHNLKNVTTTQAPLSTEAAKVKTSSSPSNPASTAKSGIAPKPAEEKASKKTKRSLRNKRDTDKTKREDKKEKKDEKPTAPKTGAAKAPMTLRDDSAVAKTNRDGIYLFMLQVEPYDMDGNQIILGEESKADVKFTLDLTVAMKGPQGYLSAIEWPLLPFYGTMCIVYVIYGIAWLISSALNWRDLLRIQFWIGAVILLGMLEKAMFFAEYESIEKSGGSVRGAVIFAELVSCLKRTLARMLVVIVSLGFGIVKPRLGADQNKVVGCGFLYFLLSSIEGCLRVVRHKSDQQQALLASIPLAVLDAAICWWVFTSLVQTTRTLRLRRNVVKLSLYRHFTNTLVFAVLASVAFMIWSIKQHRLAQCLSDWKEIWVDEAFWHLLFSIILLVIMILWRPTINNQRYAFSPLLDAADDDDEDDEAPLNDAYEGMKLRPQEGDRTKAENRKNKADDDMKWLDENIPTSVTDAALPSLLDSDEEIMTTKFEMSKME